MEKQGCEVKTKKDKSREEINKAIKEYLSRGGKITKIEIGDHQDEPMKFVGDFPPGHDCVSNPGNWIGK